MGNFESIRKTFVPPIVATIIAIGLVSDWSSAETPDSAAASDVSVTTASRSMQTDSHIKKTGYSRAGSGDATLIKLVYRLPPFTGQHDQYTQTLFRQRAMAAADCLDFVNIQCRQVMNADRPARTWWM